MRTAALLCCVTAYLAWGAGRAPAGGPDKLPGGLELLPGYSHEPVKAVRGPSGLITGKGGLKIQYSFGKVRREGDPITSADFTDRAQSLPEGERRWYKEQTVGGQPVHLALSKGQVLHVSYPRAGVNFRAEVRNPEDLADALLIILTFPEAGKK